MDEDDGTIFLSDVVTKESTKLNKLSDLLGDPLLKCTAQCLRTGPNDFQTDAFCTTARKIAKARQKVLVLKFLEAFGGNQPDLNGNLVRLDKIIRWLELAVCAEGTLLAELLYPQIHRYTGPIPIVVVKSKQDDLEKARNLKVSTINMIFEPFATPLEGVLEYVREHDIDLPSTFKLCVDLYMYIKRFPHVNSDNFALGMILRRIKDEALKKFFRDVADHGQELRATDVPVLPDLSPPQAVLDAAAVVLHIVQIHDDTIFQEEILPYEVVMTEMVLPVLQMVERDEYRDRCAVAILKLLPETGRYAKKIKEDILSMVAELSKSADPSNESSSASKCAREV